MPDDDIDSYWEGIRPQREPQKPPAGRVERPGPSRVVVTPFEDRLQFTTDLQPVNPPIQQAGRPPHGLIDRHNPDAGLSTIRSLRQSLQARALEGPPQIQAQNATGVELDPDSGAPAGSGGGSNPS